MKLHKIMLSEQDIRELIQMYVSSVVLCTSIKRSIDLLRYKEQAMKRLRRHITIVQLIVF